MAKMVRPDLRGVMDSLRHGLADTDKPLRTALVLLAIIFCTEVAIMGVFSLIHAEAWMHPFVFTMGDPVLLGLVAGVLIWFLVVIPQRRIIRRTSRLNRLLYFLSHINQVLQRQADEQRIFQDVCAAAVDPGGFHFAWIGLHEAKADGLRAVAKAARSDTCLDDVKQVAGDCVPCVLAAEAVANGRPAHCNLMTETRCRAAWREPLIAHGCRAAAAFPVRREHERIGAFCVYADEDGFFNEDEIRILEEVADDISHTLSRLAADVRRTRAEADLKNHLEELERFQKATVAREFRLKELRDMVKQLKSENGKS